MARYLLTCECGASLPVEAGQAGGKVACTCGRTLDVPPLRHLRHLPTAAPTQAERAQAGGQWSARHGVATLCLLVAGVLAGIAAWSRFHEPVVPEFNPAAHAGHMEEQIEALTPEQAWQVWVYQYKPLAEVGFAPLENRQEPAIRAYIDNQRFFQRAVLIAAGVFASIALLAALWPRSQTSRREANHRAQGRA